MPQLQDAEELPEELPGNILKYLEVGGIFLRSSGGGGLNVRIVLFSHSLMDPLYMVLPVQVCSTGLRIGVGNPSPMPATATQPNN